MNISPPHITYHILVVIATIPLALYLPRIVKKYKWLNQHLSHESIAITQAIILAYGLIYGILFGLISFVFNNAPSLLLGFWH